MNDDSDIFSFVTKATYLMECYHGKIDNNHLLSVLIMLCKAIGESEGARPKDFRRRLREIIEMKVEE